MDYELLKAERDDIVRDGATFEAYMFYYHGYAELGLDGRWVEATPAFNRELTEKFGLKPLDWDGVADSIYHPFDLGCRRHMEYLAYRGVFADIPF